MSCADLLRAAENARIIKEQGEIHRDAVNETREAYYQYHGWILSCAWCDHKSRGKTKTLALMGMQEHYRDFGIEVHA